MHAHASLAPTPDVFLTVPRWTARIMAAMPANLSRSCEGARAKTDWGGVRSGICAKSGMTHHGRQAHAQHPRTRDGNLNRGFVLFSAFPVTWEENEFADRHGQRITISLYMRSRRFRARAQQKRLLCISSRQRRFAFPYYVDA